MRKLRALFTLLLAIIMIVSCLTAQAADLETNEDPTIIDEYKNIGNFTVSFLVFSSGKTQSSALVSTYNIYDNISLTLNLQRSIDGGTWSSLFTWTASGSGTVSKTGFRYVTPGYYYRCVAYVTIRTSSGTFVESTYATSNVTHY